MAPAIVTGPSSKSPMATSPSLLRAKSYCARCAGLHETEFRARFEPDPEPALENDARMNEDFHLTPLAADVDAADLLEALGPMEERPPESQYCVFRSGRERFCLPVLDVEEVLDWPLVTKLPLAPAYLLGIFN